MMPTGVGFGHCVLLLGKMNVSSKYIIPYYTSVCDKLWLSKLEFVTISCCGGIGDETVRPCFRLIGCQVRTWGGLRCVCGAAICVGCWIRALGAVSWLGLILCVQQNLCYNTPSTHPRLAGAGS
jgi:hypothetical protein